MRALTFLAEAFILLGLGSLCMSQPISPSITSLAATGTNGFAAFSGQVNPHGIPTVAWFEWAPEFGQTNTTPVTDVGGGATDVLFSASVAGLTPGAAYFWRIIATNGACSSTSPDAIFQTPAIDLQGGSALTNECHSPFVDPGARVMAAPKATAGGYAYSMALKFDGTVAAWGGSGNGEASVPTDLANVVAIAAGEFHALALRADGKVVGWGEDYSGETTPPMDLTNAVAIAAGSGYSVALKSDGSVVAWGHNSFGQTNVPEDLSNVVAIAAGFSHALAVRSDGSVISWGHHASGDIDVPPNLSNVVAVTAGWNQSVALESNGQVVGWGETNVPAGLSNVVAIASGLFGNLALRADGTVVGWGFDYNGSISGIAALTNVIAIAAGAYHSLAITSDGTVVAFGYDSYGETDVPNNLGGNLVVSGSVNPNAVGTYTLNYTATNDLGGSGMATRTVTVVDTTPPTITLLGANPLRMPVNAPYTEPGATALDACSGDLTAGIIISGTVNTSVLGTNILTYSVADPSGNVANTNRIVVCVVGSPFVSTFPAAVSFGRASLLGTVNPNGAATTAWFEWGTNVLHGHLTKPAALGNGLTNVTLRATLAGLIPGVAYHYRIVATNSASTSAGRDVVFQNSARVVKPPAVMLRGPNPMTNECHTLFTDPGAVTVAPLSAVSASDYYSLALKADGTVGAWGNGPALPVALTKVTAIAAGYIHGLALRADGTVVGWGDNAFGETNSPLGLKDAVAIAAGWGYSLALRADGTLVCWGTNNYTPAPIPPGLSNVTAIAVGFDLCLAAKSDGTVVGWGHPSFGGTAPPAGLSNTVAVAAGFSFGLGLTAQGTVEGWGYNGEGQTSVPDDLSNVVAIAAGFDHSLALKADGTVVGWGDDFYGEATPPPGLNNVVAISAGAYHSLALKRDGTVVGWGSGFTVRRT